MVRNTKFYIPGYGNVYPYFPIKIYRVFIYIIFCATLLISTIAFSAYLIYSICIKKTSVFNGMMGKITRFHFIPLFCAGAIFMIGHYIEVNDNKLLERLLSFLISSTEVLNFFEMEYKLSPDLTIYIFSLFK